MNGYVHCYSRWVIFSQPILEKISAKKKKNNVKVFRQCKYYNSVFACHA